MEDILTKEEIRKITELKYTSAKTLLVYSKTKLTPFYWINIGDESIPFGGIIEHTNMINKHEYQDTNLIYISNYMSDDNRLYSMSAKELFEEYYPYLVKLNKKFYKEDVIKIECFEEKYAQPIITTDYSKKMLNKELNEQGIFMATMAQIYPEDRGMNYAIKLGYSVAENIKEKIDSNEGKDSNYE